MTKIKMDDPNLGFTDHGYRVDDDTAHVIAEIVNARGYFIIGSPDGKVELGINGGGPGMQPYVILREAPLEDFLGQHEWMKAHHPWAADPGPIPPGARFYVVTFD